MPTDSKAPLDMRLVRERLEDVQKSELCSIFLMVEAPAMLAVIEQMAAALRDAKVMIQALDAAIDVARKTGRFEGILHPNQNRSDGVDEDIDSALSLVTNWQEQSGERQE